MRRLLLGLAVLVLGACSGGPTGVPERDLQWRTSLRGNEVRVIVFDRTGQYRIDRVTLVGPDGQVVPARELTRESQGGSSGPGFGVFGAGGSRGTSSFGIGIDMPVGSDAGSLERRTSALIPMPPDYRRDAAQWRIDIEMITPSGASNRTSIAAPTP
jgi:hypothetical protein